MEQTINVSTQTRYKMNNGIEIPSIGYGTYQIRQKSEIENGIKTAYSCGYRLFDTAVMYNNEQLIGQSIKKLKLPRNDLFLTTKIIPQDMTYEKAKQSIDKSLKKLNTDYIDLVLIHWPGVTNPQQRIDVWKALEEAVGQGKVKSIGLSNFLKKHIEQILNNCKIKPVINQIECHPLYYDKDTIEYCKSQNIIIEAYCPLAEFHKNLIQNKNIVEIAKSLGKSVPQVILRWHLQHQIIPLPKSVHSNYIKENYDLDGFTLSEEQMKVVDGLNTNFKIDWDPHGLE